MGGITDLLSGFDGGVATRFYIGKKAERQITKFLDGWGEENLRGCIKDTIWISECIPIAKRLELKGKMTAYAEYLDNFTDEEVYGWICQKHRAFIEFGTDIQTDNANKKPQYKRDSPTPILEIGLRHNMR